MLEPISLEADDYGRIPLFSSTETEDVYVVRHEETGGEFTLKMPKGTSLQDVYYTINSMSPWPPES